MEPLKIIILWHQHQPFYKKEKEFILPWVRLHGVKDYYDLPEILHEFPSIKQTFNLVPSLMLQIDEYINYKTIDKIQRLTQIQPKLLSYEQKKQILELFFLCNIDKMVIPYSRYRDLFEKSKDKNFALNHFTDQDWLDLQVWYNLTWIGQYSRKDPKIKRLFDKAFNYTESEKKFLIDYHIEILKKIKPQLDLLRKFEQIEISISPMYHPILPLLCDSRSAHEALPGIPLPEPEFKFPDDAMNQITEAIRYYQHVFNDNPSGMWPPEGSISNEALKLMIKANIKWVASDEQVLMQSLKSDYHSLAKFFPYKYICEDGEIVIFFRDHFLSDNIGFVYSKWNPIEAAKDFCNHLERIRNEIYNKLGSEALKCAAVPIILDGENCWEYYDENGLPFLKALYTLLSDESNFQTIKCSEAINEASLDYNKPLRHVRAGSWINANFSIWIGHKDDVAAWSMLSKARHRLEEVKDNITTDQYKRAINELYIAEGSDWFWWYGDEHSAENKDQFDILFRWHIANFYTIIGDEIPEEVMKPVPEYEFKPILKEQSKKISPNIDGKLTDEDKWENAGYFDAKRSMSTMHQIGELISRFWFASDDEYAYFRCDTIHHLRPNESIQINFYYPVEFKIILNHCGFTIDSEQDLTLYKLIYASDEIIEFALCKELIYGKYADINDKPKIQLSIVTISNNASIHYPQSGKIEINLL